MSSLTRETRCKQCGRFRDVPNDLELEYLPPKWQALQSCVSCILDGPDSQSRVDPEGRHLEQVAHRLKVSGLPSRFWDSRVADLDCVGDRAAPVDALVRWVSGDLRLLFLCGEVGTGKTLMAASAARARLESRKVTWVTAPQFVMKARSSFGSERLLEADAVVSGRGDLVLDDLGKENVTRGTSELLFATIDDRLSRSSSLLITSNLKPSELGELHGSWLASRLALMHAVRVVGRDRRLDSYDR